MKQIGIVQKKVSKLTAAIAVFSFSFILMLQYSQNVYAAIPKTQGYGINNTVVAATGAKQSEIEYKPLQRAGVGAGDSTINSIVNIAFSVASGLALVFVAIGGFRYVISQGDPNATGQAKSTILYALIGLVVTILAYSIVRLAIRGVVG